MGKLSEFITRDIQLEREVIQDTGDLWKTRIIVVSAIIGCWITDFLLGYSWSGVRYLLSVIGLVGLPYIWREWQRYRAWEMLRYERAVRLEAKVDALLGLINIKDSDLEKIAS